MITKLPRYSLKDVVGFGHEKRDLNEPRNRMKVLGNFKKHTLEDKIRIVVEGESSSLLIREICSREQISESTYLKWSNELLHNYSVQERLNGHKEQNHTQEQIFNIVVEGRTGATSVAEICRRENITHDTFLKWSHEFLDFRKHLVVNHSESGSIYTKNKLIISNNSGIESFRYFENYLDFTKSDNLVILKGNSVKLDRSDNIENLVVLERINDVRFINKFFEKVNSKLEKGSVFIGCLETFSARKQRKAINKIPLLNSIYFGLEFVIKRILPKLSFTKKFYFDITKGSDRYLSKAEGLGRLVSCGFKIMDFKTIDNILYFVVKKESEPIFDMNPSYGPLYKMERLGKNGKIIGVYKFRTMHPYSEYLQDFIVNANGYGESGKPAKDFRIPSWGKFMRRFWLDEIPQLINVMKGELKLVGIRPVSQRYFDDIPKEMQKLRVTQKPGCIPPYVSLNRAGNVMSVLQSEKEYIQEKIMHPYYTDSKYFVNALINILFRHKRSA